MRLLRRFGMLAVLGVLLGVASGLASPSTAQAQNRFWLVNDTGRTILSAYVSSSRVSEWGPDILGASVLPPGQRVWVTPNFGDCVLDVRVTFQGGGEESRLQINACAISQIVFGRAGAGVGGSVGGGTGAVISPARPTANPSFFFTNGSPVIIRELYVSLNTDSSYGPDRLGQMVLQPGQRVQVNLPSGISCLTDMRVVFVDGRVLERRGVETCSINEFVWR